MNQRNSNNIYGSGQANIPSNYYIPGQVNVQPYYVPVYMPYYPPRYPIIYPHSNQSYQGMTSFQYPSQVSPQQQQPKQVPHYNYGFPNNSLPYPPNYQQMPIIQQSAINQENSSMEKNGNIQNEIQENQNQKIKPDIKVKHAFQETDAKEEDISGGKRETYEKIVRKQYKKGNLSSNEKDEDNSNDQVIKQAQRKKRDKQKNIKYEFSEDGEAVKMMSDKEDKQDKQEAAVDIVVDLDVFIKVITDEQFEILTNIQNINLQNSFRNILRELRDYVNTSFNYIYEYANQNHEKLNGKNLTDVPVYKISTPTQQSRKMFFQKFNKFVKSKKFNNSSIRQLIKNKLYSSSLKDFLKQKEEEKLKNSNSTMKDDISTFLDYLRLCLSNNQFLFFLSRPNFQSLLEKKKEIQSLELQQNQE